MKKNIIMISLLLSAASKGMAGPYDGIKSASGASGNPHLNQNMELEKLPQPDSGIVIVPSTELPQLPKEQLSAINEYKLHGFENTKSEDAIQLLSLDRNNLLREKSYISDQNPYDTHLKKNLSQIKLAFDFHEISFIDEMNVIGFAVMGTWLNGWTGVSEAFVNKELGICDYSKLNLKLGHGAAKIAQENVTYDINGHPSITYVEGNNDFGYAYKVSWFDDIFYHTVKCALKKYDKDELNNVIKLSKLIDSDQ